MIDSNLFDKHFRSIYRVTWTHAQLRTKHEAFMETQELASKLQDFVSRKYKIDNVNVERIDVCTSEAPLYSMGEGRVWL